MTAADMSESAACSKSESTAPCAPRCWASCVGPTCDWSAFALFYLDCSAC